MKSIRLFQFGYFLVAVALIGFDVWNSVQTKSNVVRFEVLLLFISVPIVFVIHQIDKLKFGKDGIEIEKTKDQVGKLVHRFATGKSINIDELGYLYKSVYLNDWAKLVLTRMLMRKGMVQLFPDHGLGDSPSLTRLIALGVQRNAFGQELAFELERLRNITYFAEWWSGVAPTNEDWDWAVSNGQRVATQIFMKMKINA